MVCTSIGLTVKGVPVVGVIYNPFMDQLVRRSLILIHRFLLNLILLSIRRGDALNCEQELKESNMG